MDETFSLKSVSDANFINVVIGSDPGDNTNTIGASVALSANTPAKSNGGTSVNFSPKFSITKSRAAGITLSGLKQRKTNILLKESKDENLPGKDDLCGSNESYTAFHSLANVEKSL